MAVTLGVGADDITADYGVLIRNALLPAFMAGFLAILIDRIVSKPQDADRTKTPAGDSAHATSEVG